MKDTIIHNRFFKIVKKNWLLFMILLPTLIWYVIFKYIPMGGASLAFKTFRYDCGIWASPWCGLENFKLMFHERAFLQAFRNTLIFGMGKIVFQFPIPIIMAILINEIKNEKSKKFFQTVFTFPHFISWVVLASIFSIIFSSNGALNQFLVQLGGEPWLPMLNPDTFRPFIWISNSWKEFGWDTIIYLAALTSIDPKLYEAAEVDGASRFQKIRYVTLPGMKSIICVMLILQVGNIMGSASFDQIFNMYSPVVYSTGDILDTYVQRYTFEKGSNFGYTSAVGLFNSVVGVIMITIANKFAMKHGEKGLL